MKAIEKTINSKDKIEYNSMILVLLIITMSMLLTACSGNVQKNIDMKRSTAMNDSTKIVDLDKEALQKDVNHSLPLKTNFS